MGGFASPFVGSTLNPLLATDEGRKRIEDLVAAKQQAAQVAANPTPTITAPGTSTPPAVAPIRPVKPSPAPMVAPADTVNTNFSGTANTPSVAPVSPQPVNPQFARNREYLSHLQNTGSGIQQLPKGARIPLSILDAIGSTFLPGLMMGLPGTQLHHQMLLRGAQTNVKGDEAAQENAARQKLQAAQTEEAEARAESLRNPAEKAQTPHTVTTAAGIMQYNPETQRFDIPVGEAPAKAENEGKTVTTDQGVMQWDPKTKRFDIEVGKAPGAKGGTVHQLEDGTLVVAHPDGTATPVTVNGQPVKGKMPAEKQDQETQYVNEYMQKHKGATIAQAQRAYALNKHIEEPPKPPVVMVPGAGGTVTPQVARFGVPLPGNIQTMTGVNAANTPTSQTRTMAETAPKVIELADRVSQLVDQQEKELGPAASRWNEFMAGKVGAPNAEFTKLRTDVGLLQTLLMRMHVGARGGEQIMEHFANLINSSKQSPENLRAALGEIRAYANEVAQTGHAAGGATTALPSPTSKAEYDALPKGSHYMKNGEERIKQ